MTRRQLPALVVLSLGVLSCALQAQSRPELTADSKTKAILLKHLTISRDFTLKIAEQMPEADYDFKLTPAQMSFGEQMVHLAETFEEFVAPPAGGTLALGKPASMSKPDVISFVRKSFDTAIERVTKLVPGQLAKAYTSYGVTATGLEFLMELLDHTTQHRASAEMYLRVKGITPAAYQF
jgi:uncharacterized damage-inducible protein DinB